MQLSDDMLLYSTMMFNPRVRWTRIATNEGRLTEKSLRPNNKTVRFSLTKKS
jgi:hypothetical protein